MLDFAGFFNLFQLYLTGFGGERGIRTILLTPLLITISKFQSLQVSVKSRFKQLFNLTFPLLFCYAKIRISEAFMPIKLCSQLFNYGVYR